MRAPVVDTTYGKVSGFHAGGADVFRGIPYGGSVSGKARFRPLTPPDDWMGVRDCLDFGPAAHQVNRGDPDVQKLRGVRQEAQAEDCLFLNVWAPAESDGRRPVMVWLHGGAFVFGSGATVDGTALAETRNVVVVSLNHRLGALGHLYLDEISGGEYVDSGLIGLLDIVAALEWVQKNISAFGGDPSRVTIFGVSGGALKASTLMAMPAARGLFHGAIMQSGPYIEGVDPKRATDVAERVLRHCGIPVSNIAALHDVSAEKLLKVQEDVTRELAVKSSDAFGLWTFGPTVAGASLPHHPFKPNASPCAADVALMIGHNSHEGHIALAPKDGSMHTAAGVRTIAERMYGDRADALLALYARERPEAMPNDVVDGFCASDGMLTDDARIAERKAAGGSAPVYVYRFAYETEVLNGRFRSGHTLEVPFVFNNARLNKLTGERPERLGLASIMSQAWANFATYGNPNHPDLPEWPRYSTANRNTMIFDVPCRLEADRPAFREGLIKLGVQFNP